MNAFNKAGLCHWPCRLLLCTNTNFGVLEPDWLKLTKQVSAIHAISVRNQIKNETKKETGRTFLGWGWLNA